MLSCDNIMQSLAHAPENACNTIHCIKEAKVHI